VKVENWGKFVRVENWGEKLSESSSFVSIKHRWVEWNHKLAAAVHFSQQVRKIYVAEAFSEGTKRACQFKKKHFKNSKKGGVEPQIGITSALFAASEEDS